MNATNKHTLKPVQLRCEVTDADYRIVTENGAPICIAPRVAGSPCFKSEPLSELARRWNAYPALLAALEAYVAHVDAYGPTLDQHIRGGERPVIEAARAALRIARGS